MKKFKDVGVGKHFKIGKILYRKIDKSKAIQLDRAGKTEFKGDEKVEPLEFK